jgi:hypothetical protein
MYPIWRSAIFIVRKPPTWVRFPARRPMRRPYTTVMERLRWGWEMGYRAQPSKSCVSFLVLEFCINSWRDEKGSVTVLPHRLYLFTALRKASRLRYPFWHKEDGETLLVGSTLLFDAMRVSSSLLVVFVALVLVVKISTRRGGNYPPRRVLCVL